MCRWPACTRRPAPAPAGARLALRPVPGLYRSGSPVRFIRNPAATSVSRTGTSRARPGGQCWFCVVISTHPRPAAAQTSPPTPGRSRSRTRPATRSAGPARRAPRPPDRGYPQLPRPQLPASSANSARSTVGSSAANCQHTPTSARCRCAYSTATLVFPAPPARTTPPPAGRLPPGPPAGRPAPPAALPARQRHRPRPSRTADWMVQAAAGFRRCQQHAATDGTKPTRGPALRSRVRLPLHRTRRRRARRHVP